MSIGNDRIVRDKFRQYLVEHCGLRYTTASNYIWSLNVLSNYLTNNGVISGSLYDIKNIHKLLCLKTQLANSDVFRIAYSRCGNVSLSTSLRHYYNFMAHNSESDHCRCHNTRVRFQVN